jgi:hypothetical protein
MNAREGAVTPNMTHYGAQVGHLRASIAQR